VDSCGLILHVGTPMFFVAGRDDRGRYSPSICTHHEVLDNAGRGPLVTEAEAAFGAGRAPVAVPEVEDPGSGDSRGGLAPDVTVIAGIGFVGLVGAGLLLFVGLAARRRSGTGDGPAA
jgi:hypothetical protein